MAEKTKILETFDQLGHIADEILSFPIKSSLRFTYRTGSEPLCFELQQRTIASSHELGPALEDNGNSKK